ncbi:polyketide synthase [Streptomyces sp. HPF1205]|uniref:beta-ketoacyl synthase N-terminal-like domain-containing protein n=1 Tax=Streptomyces sp. HPF1205 TaxID=2873262 RepID=UPI001CECC8EB|nr:polyketide synthase [Streptomyces sp. HPF1205]
MATHESGESRSPGGATALTRALSTIKRLRAELEEARGEQPLAVVGIGLRMPGGIHDLDGYWEALAAGRDLIRPLPEHRKGPFAEDWKGLPQQGGFLDDVFGFDAPVFGIGAREAPNLDPQQRLLLEVGWEALEDAGLPASSLGDRVTGFFVGVTNHDYADWRPAESDFLWGVGNHPCYAAGRVAHTLGFTGPAMTVDTSCSSSLVTVHLARQALARKECDIALAAGVNLIVSPSSTELIAQSGLLAADGRCKPFDASANGFTRSEGCGVVVLKRLSDAIRDNDRVHAVISGSAVNQDGRSASITAPNVLSQIALFRAALASAGLTPADIGLVEAHGTGTALGDPIEMEAIVAGLDRAAGGPPLRVGSVKANLGHLESAAGVAGLIKAIACVREAAVPPLTHFRTLNPRIDLTGTGITLPTALTGWDGGGRHAAVSSFGMSGTNAQVIVGPPPAPGPAAAGAPDPEPVPVSGFEVAARTPEALRELAGRYAAVLDTLKDADYPAFAYTATFGRARHRHRARITATDPAAARAALAALASGAIPEHVGLSENDDPGTSEAPLPRRVLSLPAYPWQRREHVTVPARFAPAEA